MLYIAGICRMTVQPMSSGLWTIYMVAEGPDVSTYLSTAFTSMLGKLGS